MFTLTRLLPWKRLATEQLPAMLPALAVTEVLFKLHSFTLECGAFLATWFVFDAVLQGLKARLVQAGGRVP